MLRLNLRVTKEIKKDLDIIKAFRSFSYAEVLEILILFYKTNSKDYQENIKNLR